VQRFIDGRLSYVDIARTVADCLAAAPSMPCDCAEAVFEANTWVRRRLDALEK
jgi:1-deoxy-D-xylulose 5-phosphate reductoisomerase